MRTIFKIENNSILIFILNRDIVEQTEVMYITFHLLNKYTKLLWVMNFGDKGHLSNNCNYSGHRWSYELYRFLPTDKQRKCFRYYTKGARYNQTSDFTNYFNHLYSHSFSYA